MAAKRLHIITLNIPWPPDYGGMIDSFYRIRSLNDAGVEIILHCFEYGRPHSSELESCCKEVFYYPRKTSLSGHFSIKPYTVLSRDSGKLLSTLLKDDHPALFDGLHTTLLLRHPALAGRKKFARVHNIEHNYYHSLALFEQNPLKKIYYSLESLKLKHYERILNNADILFTISETDQDYFEGRYHNAELITPFHPFNKIESITGSGDYVIFHGDLSVSENETVAEYLITKIFSQVPFRCIVAGKNPSHRLISAASEFRNVSVIADPDSGTMNELIRNAHINLLYTITSNGLRLKLLIALFAGRHCIVNSNITEGTRLGPACHIEDSAQGIIDRIHFLMKQNFAEKIKADREQILQMYSNSFNTQRLLKLIFPEEISS